MQKVQLPLLNRTIDAYLYEAASDEKRPGILFLPDLTGIRDTTHKSAEILSNEGDTAADLHYRNIVCNF